MVTHRESHVTGYALSEGAVGSDGGSGLGIVLRDKSGQRIATASQSTGARSEARCRLAAITHALRFAHAHGLRRVVVYCSDRSLVKQISREAAVAPEHLAPCLEIRALLNMFRRAEVRSIPWFANLEALWLARRAASHSPGETQALQRILPLDAA